MSIDKPWLDLKRNNNGTIMKPDELENELRDPPDDINSDILDRIHGSMIGMALGDALGAFVEFRPHEYMVQNPVKTLKGGGTWGLDIGQVSSRHTTVLPFFNQHLLKMNLDTTIVQEAA